MYIYIYLFLGRAWGQGAGVRVGGPITLYNPYQGLLAMLVKTAFMFMPLGPFCLGSFMAQMTDRQTDRQTTDGHRNYRLIRPWGQIRCDQQSRNK